MKYFSSILLALTLLFSCTTDVEKADGENPIPNTNTTAPSKTTARPIVESNTFEGQLVTLSRTYLKYSNNGTSKTNEVQTELAKITHKDLAKAKSFVFESTQRSSKLLTKTFLQKPTKKELQTIYQLRFVNWNSMSLTPVTEEVLDKLDLSTVSDTDLLTAYYNLLTSPLATNIMQPDPFKEVNIDLNKLGLKNEKEKGILFYNIATKFARKYSRYARVKKDNCNKVKEMTRSFPSINGKTMFEVTPPKFEDFTFVLSNNMPDASFNAIYSPSYEKAKAHFLKCKF